MIESPDRMTRWRCSRCGNLTRFDVLRLRRAKEYWHFDLGGEVSVEDQFPHDDIGRGEVSRVRHRHR